jgi:dihydrofolate reductase
MRKLKLQVQITLDGFVGGPNRESDWITWDTDDKFKKRILELADSVDTIIMGRKMTDEFVTYWTDVVENKPEFQWYELAKKMVDIPKVVITKTLKKSNWANTTLAMGDIAEEVNKLKNKEGKGIIVYGGADFVSSLIKNNLIDEYHLLINSIAIGKGLSIFGKLENYLRLKFVSNTVFDCGIIENVYVK